MKRRARRHHENRFTSTELLKECGSAIFGDSTHGSQAPTAKCLPCSQAHPLSSKLCPGLLHEDVGIKFFSLLWRVTMHQDRHCLGSGPHTDFWSEGCTEGRSLWWQIWQGASTECANATLWQGKRAGSWSCCSEQSLVLLFPVSLPFSSSSFAYNTLATAPSHPSRQCAQGWGPEQPLSLWSEGCEQQVRSASSHSVEL